MITAKGAFIVLSQWANNVCFFDFWRGWTLIFTILEQTISKIYAWNLNLRYEGFQVFYKQQCRYLAVAKQPSLQKLGPMSLVLVSS